MWSLIRCPYLRNAVCGIQFSSVQFMCVESTMWGFHARRAGPRDIRIMAYIARRQHTGTVLQQYTFRPHTNYVRGVSKLYFPKHCGRAVSPSAAVWSIPHRGYCSSFLINYFRQKYVRAQLFT